MIETEFFILDEQQYEEFYPLAEEMGISLDHYLLEWCDVTGPDVLIDS